MGRIGQDTKLKIGETMKYTIYSGVERTANADAVVRDIEGFDKALEIANELGFTCCIYVCDAQGTQGEQFCRVTHKLYNNPKDY